MKLRKFLAVTVALTFGAAGLAACSSGGGTGDETSAPETTAGETSAAPETTDAAPVTIEWWHNSNTDPGMGYYQKVADDYTAAHPNVTAIDTTPILAQIQHVLDQVIGAVQFLFAFTLAAGLLVLYAALAGTRDERVRESALLRALGASHRQVRSVHVAEFAVVGALAGLMAATGAQALGIVLATRVFDFHLDVDPWMVPAGIAAGIACSGVGGWLSLRRVLSRPAAQSLRDA